MRIPELRKTVRTYTDDELIHMISIAKWCENRRKERILNEELDRRESQRKDGTYVDETLDPKVNLQKRLSKGK